MVQSGTHINHRKEIAMGTPNYLKKISTGTVGLAPKQMNVIATDEKFAGKPVPVMRVYGTARGTKKGTSNFGPYIGFLGEFEAINLCDGQKYRSKTLLLPSLAEQMLADSLDEAKSKSPDAFIEFGLDVTAEKNVSAKGGWEFKWGIKPLKQPEFLGETDSLSKLGQSLGELPLMIAPPAKAKK